MRVKDAVGKFGEDAACAHLQAQGWEVLERNWRCPQGELDIIAREGATLVFVEVKTRSSVQFGLPAEAVTRAKVARLRRLAACWIADRRAGSRALSFVDVRIDVVAVVRRARGDRPQIDHYRGAV